MGNEDLKIFIVATHGEGEPTNNAQAFYFWMKKCLKTPDVKPVWGNFIVFGLGDSQYEHFNAMGKFTKETLAKLGGNLIFEYGESDHEY